MKSKTPVTKKKTFSGYRIRVRSRHPSHSPFRTQLPRLPFQSVVRLGSETEVEGAVVECNSVKAVRNSASKLLMKQCFTQGGVTTAQWYRPTNAGKQRFTNQIGEPQFYEVEALPYPLIVKSLYGSRGRGNSLISNPDELKAFMVNNQIANYILEEYKKYTREYRIHCTEDGCFYTCRKMLKRDTPEDKKFQRHDDNCAWFVEENPGFDKPVNWNAIVADCVKALKSLGLDIGAFDLKVQSAKDGKGRVRDNPEWIIIESCSAPSMGDITLQKYLVEIPKVLTKKHQNKNK